MADLLSSLSIATSGLAAARTGLDVTGNNIANVNTPGFSRRRVDLAERPATEPYASGRGVDVTNVRALRDMYVEARLRGEQGGQQFDRSQLDGLRGVEAAIGLPGDSLDARLGAFFDAFSVLAADVTSPANRDAVVRQGQMLAGAFGSLSTRFTDLQQATNREIQDAVTELNTLASTVARLNDRIVAGGAGVETLRDERGIALTRMAELGSIRVIEHASGAVDVTVPSGHALVVGANAYSVAAVPQPPSGLVALQLGGFDITSQMTGGQIGGLVDVRDVKLPAYLTALDQLAWDVATQVNALHATGFDANATPGGTFFDAPGGVAGAAAALRVSAAIVADSQLVAASGPSGPGDNQVARALAALRESRVMNGGTATPAEAWSALVYRVGSDIRQAEASVVTRDQIVLQLQRLRDQHSGVSLDEEAANLIRFQRSYEASARFFTTIVDTLDTLMALVR